MRSTISYSWKQFDGDVQKIRKLLSRKKVKFNSVWGPARGGLILAVCLSHALGIPLVKTPLGRKTLIADDIADTGRTLKKFADKNYFIVTLFYHRQSVFRPQIWFREKKDKWVHFPWEA